MEGPRSLEGREVPLGGVRGMSVTRWLPHRGLPTVGAWCFLDRIGPQRVDMRVQPHPHTALQTVTWPLAGEIRHRDSLGSDVVVRPGELNLMTAGRGVSHSEHSLGRLPLQHAVQLWVVLPRAQDGAPARFEQQRELPVLEVRGGSSGGSGGRGAGARATVLVGSLGEGSGAAVSPARVAPGLVGADVVLDPGADVEVPVDPAHEHALLDLAAGPGAPPVLRHWPPGPASLRLRHSDGARQLLLGGVPAADDLVMWWNFVGRTHDDVVEARAAWEDPEASAERFGTVPGHAASERIPAPPLPPVRLTPRRRRDPLPGTAPEAPAFS